MDGIPSPEKSADMTSESVRSGRRLLRKHALAAREALISVQYENFSAAVREHLAQAFPQLATQRVGFCWPIRNEPDLRPLMQRWRTAGHPGFMALLPVVTAPEQLLLFRAWQPGGAMIEDRYGIATPVEGAFIVPEVLLIPVNAFDAQGYRLGYGGGFFDRTLAALRPRPLAIGVGFELARVDTIHPCAHDTRLDAIVTETGVFRPEG